MSSDIICVHAEAFKGSMDDQSCLILYAYMQRLLRDLWTIKVV